jgi:Fe-S cluster assembly ATP-binding protein
LGDVGLDPAFLGRYLNEGFSGGEKKRSKSCNVGFETAMAFDEPDSV